MNSVSLLVWKPGTVSGPVNSDVQVDREEGWV